MLQPPDQLPAFPLPTTERSKHSRPLDPRVYRGAEQASHTKPRPWDVKDQNRKKAKRAKASRRKNRK